MHTTPELTAPNAPIDDLRDIFKEGSRWTAHTTTGIKYDRMSYDAVTGRPLYAFADAAGHIAVLSHDVNLQSYDVYTIHATGQPAHVLVEPTVSELVAGITVSIAMSQGAAQRNNLNPACGQ